MSISKSSSSEATTYISFTRLAFHIILNDVFMMPFLDSPFLGSIYCISPVENAI